MRSSRTIYFYLRGYLPPFASLSTGSYGSASNVRILITNDCSQYHYGSRLTMKVLKKMFSEYGTVTTRNNCKDLLSHDLIIINGEGTFHGNRSASRKIYETAKKAKRFGKRVCLVNSVIDRISYDLSIFDCVFARESKSSRGIYPYVHDACFGYEIKNKLSEDYILYVDSVIKKRSRELEAASKSCLKPSRFLKMCLCKNRKVLDIFAKASLVVTGRYHGVVFAMMMNKPFVAVESNTHKISGLLQDYGLGHCLCKEPRKINQMIHYNPPNVDNSKIKEGLLRMAKECVGWEDRNKVSRNVPAIREQQQLDRSDVPPVPRSVRIRPLQQ